jgi:outer membrane protein OmpA-like peptidoglycan-associated protein
MTVAQTKKALQRRTSLVSDVRWIQMQMDLQMLSTLVRTKKATKVGCPRAVRVEGTQIVILQSVNFATGSDVINANSFTLLEQVAAVLAEHPEIVRVAVDGHTDNAGITKANITLSEKRSVSVVTWLVDHGIDARRLEARGFGPRRPIATNGTPEGKAKNRRVEFQILKRSTEGSSAWRAGTVQ